MNGKFGLRQEGFMSHNFLGEIENRDQFWVMLRKSKRGENIQLKRNKNFSSPQATPVELVSELYLLRNIPENEVTFTDICKLLPVTSHLDTLLIYLNSTIILQPRSANTMEQLQMTPTLLSILDYNSPTSTLSNACLLLCNYIALTDSSDELLSSNLISILISLINPCSLPLIENIIWCFSNIACEGLKQTQVLINANLIEILYKLLIDLKPVLSNSLIKAFGLFFSNISKYSELLDEVFAKQIARLASEVIKGFKSLNVRCFFAALNNLAKNESFIDIMIEMKIPDLVLTFIDIPKYTFKVIQFIQHVVSGNNSHTFYMIDKPIFNIFEMYIDSENLEITEVILFSVSNIISVIESIETLQKTQLLHKSFRHLTSSSEKVQIEASYLLKSVLNKASDSQLAEILNFTLLESVISAFDTKNPDLTKHLLYSSSIVLRFLLKELDITFKEHLIELLNKISKLVESQNLEISEIAEEILNSFNS